MNVDTTLIASLVALAAGIAAIIKSIKTPVGEQASAAEKYQRIANQAISDCEAMRADVDRLRVQLGELEIKIADYEHGVGLLIHQLRAQQIDPVWEPRKE